MDCLKIIKYKNTSQKYTNSSMIHPKYNASGSTLYHLLLLPR